MPSIPMSYQESVDAGKPSLGMMESLVAMGSLVSLVCAFCYITFAAIRTIKTSLLSSVEAKQRLYNRKGRMAAASLKNKKEQQENVGLMSKRNSSDDDEADEDEDEEEEEDEQDLFDAELDAMIEEATRSGAHASGVIQNTSLDAQLPDIHEGLRKRSSTAYLRNDPSDTPKVRDAKKHHRKLMKNLQKLYEFDEEDMIYSGEESDDALLKPNHVVV
ncbi:hypothetical protein BJ741DRAFT_604124 [Chytriomyces cf. hyalinus JEL632]|nr:hypothetical protein BJ741DRAFT_604124 [Chytriomyces cf. hyalinus JEL632]